MKARCSIFAYLALFTPAVLFGVLVAMLVLLAGCQDYPQRDLEVMLGTATLHSNNRGANTTFGRAEYETITDPNGVTRTKLTVVGYELAMQEAYQAWLEKQQEAWKALGAIGAAVAGAGMVMP